MTVTQIALDSGEIDIGGDTDGNTSAFIKNGEPADRSDEDMLRKVLSIGVLCNNASFQQEDGEHKAVGDPMEIALLVAGAKAGLDQNALLETKPEVHEEAFDSDVKMMATFHEDDSRYLVAVKGAPESVLEVCSFILTKEGDKEGEREISEGDRKQWLERNRQMAEDGLRVLALAEKAVDTTDAKPYECLTFLGLLGLVDPPRMDVRQAIDLCQDAGIRAIMVTGDQPVTARNIGLAVGLVDESEVKVIHGKDLKSLDEWSEEDREHVLQASILARVSPKQKLDLITVHQRNGSIVAMTGDGVNDAPALKKADIGIAMGQRGTQVAREAADMVLKDDAFSTIVVAVEQGRIIFDNIRKVVLYLLSCNVSEVMVVGLASLVNAPLPILPLQILFINLVTDVFPALALGVGEGDPAIMKRPPRDPSEPILSRQHWLTIAGYGLIMTVAVLGAFALAFIWLEMGERQAVSVSFLTLAIAQLWHVFNMRDRGSRFLRNDVTRNRFVWGALVLCAGLLLAAVYLPSLSTVLKVVDPGMRGWMLVIGMSLIPWMIGQLLKSISK